jgi:hypothetical protein
MLLLENISKDELKNSMKEFYNYALTKLKKIDRPPKVILKQDKKNADNIFGKTGHYDPDKEIIVLYTTDRHPKDILRSFAHELIHHHQKCSGRNIDLNLSLTATDPAYASHDKGLREMEKQAFRWGNMIFRDWCDMKKTGENTMSESKDLIGTLLERVTQRLIQEAKKGKKKKAAPSGDAKPDFLDLDGDGNKENETMKQAAAQAKEKKGGVKPKSKKGKGKVPPQLEKYVKAKQMKKEGRDDAKEFSKHSHGKVMSQEEISNPAIKESTASHPHPVLNERKERLFNERFKEYEEWKFQELLKRAIK